MKKVIPNPAIFSINVISTFLILAILRLLPFNFFLSVLVGHEVVIDNNEANAINFVNYLATLFLLVVVLIKLPVQRYNWSSSWIFVAYIAIYVFNYFTAPYVDSYWIVYQLIFIGIAMFLHNSVSQDCHYQIDKSSLSIFIKGVLCFIVVICYLMYTTYPLDFILEYYNDSFNHSVNQIGVMKQYYGYITGFVVLYALFVIKNKWWRFLIILLALLPAFGIRSMLIGFFGVILIASLRRMRYFVGLLALTFMVVFFTYDQLLMKIIYDTRFYPYLNVLNIVNEYPFGVGLGGYPVYTEANNMHLYGLFYDYRSKLDFLPTAPESDIVHVFGSLGLPMGILHFFLLFYILIKGYMNISKMLSFEKFMYFYLIFMTFYGISEDSVFNVSYWIFLGITSGLISNAHRRNL